MKTRCSETVVRALEDADVRFTFGIPGTHNVELYDALERSGVLPILVTDEQAASFMADAVSRSSSSIGVVNVVPGAGVTHTLSGVAEAFMDNIPILVLAAGIRSDTGHAFQLHDIDQLALLRPITKAVFKVEAPGEVYPTIRRAIDLARAGAPGPVAVEVPANFYMLAQNVPSTAYTPDEAGPPAPDAAAVREAATLLRAAKHPVLYVGNGAAEAAEMLVTLAERLGAPVATTIQGKGVFPESNPLWLWNGLGRSTPGYVQRVTEACDCMLAIGCRFGEVATASYGFTPPERLIHVDIASEVLNRNYPAEIAVTADAARFVEALLDELGTAPAKRKGPVERIAEGRRELATLRRGQRSENRVSPAVLFAALQAQAGEDAIYTTDSGNGTFLAMEHLRLERPGRFLAPVDYSSMGYAIPAAIGAKLANRDTDVIALAGDGALLMTGLELLTAAHYGAAPAVFVLHDGELSQIAQFQRMTLDSAPCSILPDYSVADLARFTKSTYLRLERDEESKAVVAEALAQSRAGAPVMVDVAIDYSLKTFFTKGVVATNFWRLSWSDRLRIASRAVSRRLRRTSPPDD